MTTTADLQRPFPWEKNYPPGVKWDVPIAQSPVPDVLEKAAARFADRPAFTYAGRTISYREFARHVEAIAAALAAEGVGKDTPVALFLPNTPWHPVFFFAILKAGGRVVHVSPLDAEREIVHKLKDSGARLLVTTDLAPQLVDGAEKIVAAGLVPRLIIGEDARWRGGALPPRRGAALSGAAMLETPPRPAGSYPATTPDDVALLQYTGGTTGPAKAAMLTHGNLTATLSIVLAWSEPQGWIKWGEDASILVLPLFHIFAIMTVMGAIHTGSNTVLHPRFDPEAVVKDIETFRPTGFTGVPTMWIALINLPGIEARDLSSLKFARSGGAAAPIEVENRVKDLTGCRLGGGWGMTETSPAGTNIPVAGPVQKGGTIGLPMPGIHMDIVALDDPRRRLPPGEVGEIRIRGPNVIKSYYNRPDENAKSFVDGYLLTGDIGKMDEDGFFFIVDRKKDMIISGGFNVYPRNIEEAIYEYPGVAEVIVIGVPDDYRGEAAKAFVALKPGAAAFTLEQLKAFLADKIGRHEMPADLEFRPSLPKTAVGKLAKKDLVAEERAKRA